MDEKLVCGLTDSQITALKKKHGFLVIVTIQQGGIELKENINRLETLLLEEGDKLPNKKQVEEDLKTAKDSPVKIDSFTEKSFDERIIPSAGIKAPSSN